MNDRIEVIRRQIRELRVSMFETEALMHNQLVYGADCSEAADRLLKMRVSLGELARERTRLGDSEPILVKNNFIPQRPAVPRPVYVRPMGMHPFTMRPKKQRLVPPYQSRV